MQLKDRSPFVEYKVKQDLSNIKNSLSQSGYYFSKVEVSVQENNNDTVDAESSSTWNSQLQYPKETNLKNIKQLTFGGDNAEAYWSFDDTRIVLKLDPRLAPIKVAVIPLKKNNSEIVKLAHKIKDSIQSLRIGRIVIENTGNIGKSYRKHDEIGTPICITVDFDSLENDDVTIRDRDTMEQIRQPISKLSEFVKQQINK